MNLLEPILLGMSVIVFPLLAQRKFKTASSLFMAAAVVYLLFGAIGYFLGTDALDNNSAFHDTYVSPNRADGYYAVSTFHYRVNIAIVLALLAALLWVQKKLNALRFERTTFIIFWVMNLGLLFSYAAQQVLLSALESPANIANNLSLFRTMDAFSSWMTFVSAAMFPLLVVLFTVSILLRVIPPSK